MTGEEPPSGSGTGADRPARVTSPAALVALAVVAMLAAIVATAAVLVVVVGPYVV